MNISAVLLAGGQSRRMGRDKAIILFRGKPLWQIQLGLLRKLQPAEIFVSAGNDFSLQALTNQLVKTGKLRAVRVPEEEQRCYWNFNEPADMYDQPGSRIAF